VNPEAFVSVCWNFGNIPVSALQGENRLEARSPLGALRLPGVIQRKLVVGEFNDPLEHEADCIADRVMCMPDPGDSITGTVPQSRRKCASCEEDEKTLRMERAAGSLVLGGEAPTIVHEVLRSPGTRLDARARAFFEPRFRRDFANVRIHDDARAALSAREVGALAYTVGQHVVIGEARGQAESVEGRRLLAHELAHTVQQSAPGNEAPSRVARTARSLTETLDPALLADDELTTEIREIRTLLDRQSESSEQGDMLAHAVARLGAELIKRHPPTRLPSGAPRAPEGVSVADVLHASSVAGGMMAVGGLSPQPVLVPAPPPPVVFPPTVVPPTVVPPTVVPPTVVPPTVAPPTVVPPTVTPGPAPAAGVGIGAAATAILVFIVVMLWPRDSIMSGREEQRELDEARRQQAAPQAPQPGSAQAAPAPVMTPGLSPADQKQWKECETLYEDYKGTQQRLAARSAAIDRILDNIANNRPVTDQERVDLCNFLDEQIALAESLHQKRSKYIEAGCDKFDWFNQGTTEAQRRASHQAELDNVDKQLKNLRQAQKDNCPPFASPSKR